MALTPDQLAQREGKITASFLPQLMAGDTGEIYHKWLELIGDPDWKPKDLSDNFPVFHGTIMEPHVIDWHQRKTGHALTRRGEVVQHPTRPYVCATLDCYREADRCVLDCKCPGAWMTLDHIIAHYTPQVIVQRACAQCDNAALLISHGGATPNEFAITIEPAYEATVWQRVDQFWQCVQELREPVELPPAPPPPPWRSVDLDREAAAHNWATPMIGHLIDWENTRDQAVAHDAAREEIKALLPDDVGRVRFGTVLITRARNRAVTIKRVT
jgi:YqaJ-like viral recombinase domain